MRVALGLEYHGGFFCGWQSQPNRRGVQDALEHALSQVAGMAVRVHAAGRTDTGVHASLQVIHFETVVTRPLQAWVRGCNAYLPPALRVLWACPVTNDFHARFSALSRAYEYRCLSQPTAPAILHGLVGWTHRPLLLSPMQAAAAQLMGTHDFSAFRASECQASTPIRTLHMVAVIQEEGLFRFRFQANAFLQHQIRNMVGALLYVGYGKLSVEGFSRLLMQQDRQLSPPTFMPDGLYFAGAEYASDWQLPETLPDWASRTTRESECDGQ